MNNLYKSLLFLYEDKAFQLLYAQPIMNKIDIFGIQ